MWVHGPAPMCCFGRVEKKTHNVDPPADRAAPTRQHELDHKNQEPTRLKIPGSSSANRSYVRSVTCWTSLFGQEKG